MMKLAVFFLLLAGTMAQSRGAVRKERGAVRKESILRGLSAKGSSKSSSDDVMDPIVSTTLIFGPNTMAGVPPMDADLGLLSGATFDGDVLFVQIGAFYIAGGAGLPLSTEGLANLGSNAQSNNRAFGLVGSGTASVEFVPETVERVVLQVRGSAGGEMTGAMAVTPAPSTELTTASGLLQVVFETSGDEDVTLQFPIPNDGYELFVFDIENVLSAEFITEIRLVNSGPANSVLALGELTVNTGMGSTDLST